MCYLPITCIFFFISSIVPTITYLLANKEEMVYVRFKTPENTPLRSMTSLHLLDSQDQRDLKCLF